MRSLPPVALVGSQRPTLLHLPDGIAGAGQEAIDLARECGLSLDDWQEFVIKGMLLERPDHRWAATEVGCEVPRQNGKNVIQEVIELAALILFKERLILHSAHLYPTALEHFLRMQFHFENVPILAAMLDDIKTANGKEVIIVQGGGRLKFFARQRGGGRGFTGDRAVYDEAFSLDAAAVGAMIPALSARSMEIPGPQIMYFSSPAHAQSAALHSVRNRARAGAPRLAYFGWLNERGTDKTDRDAWYRVNPGLGVRIAEEFVETELAALEGLGDEFERERLGIPSDPLDGGGVFPAESWSACLDPSSRAGETRTIALDVAPGMAWATFAGASKVDDLTVVEVIARHQGTGWIIERALELNRWGPIWLDPRGPAGGLTDDLLKAGVKFEELPDGQMSRACNALQEKVLGGTLRHVGDPPLDAAVQGASVRLVGDSWRWSRTSSSVDISPLVAVTVAAWVSSGNKVPHFYAFGDDE